MDKAQALARLQALENETAALRKIIEAPEVAGSLLTKPEPGSFKDYWGLKSSGVSQIRADGFCANNSDSEAYAHGSIFQSKELAAAYADAIETMLLLRHQPGTVEAENGGWQCIITIADDGKDVIVYGFDTISEKAGQISPVFSEQEHALAAINTIGADRILRMFKTLHHVAD